MKKLLHISSGPCHILGSHGFNQEEWQEIRLDIDPAVQPDIICDMLDMSQISANSIDAVYSSHNLEHLYPHELPLALGEIYRVLKDDGVLALTCPDLQSVCALVAKGNFEEQAYLSPAGPIFPMDIIFGYRPALAQGMVHMAHKMGFTQKSLHGALKKAGFKSVAGMRVKEKFALYAVAKKQLTEPEQIKNLFMRHWT